MVYQIHLTFIGLVSIGTVTVFVKYATCKCHRCESLLFKLNIGCLHHCVTCGRISVSCSSTTLRSNKEQNFALIYWYIMSDFFHLFSVKIPVISRRKCQVVQQNCLLVLKSKVVKWSFWVSSVIFPVCRTASRGHGRVLERKFPSQWISDTVWSFIVQRVVTLWPVSPQRWTLNCMEQLATLTFLLSRYKILWLTLCQPHNSVEIEVRVCLKPKSIKLVFMLL